MVMKNSVRLILVALVIMPAIAQAHEYWIEPNRFFFIPEEGHSTEVPVITYEFTGGDSYFYADVNRIPTGEYRFELRDPDGKAVNPISRWQGKTREVAEALLKKPGTYALGLTRIGKPMYYTELTNGDYIPKSKKELTKVEADQAKESVAYYQHAKTYISATETSDSYKSPLDHALEFIALSHPNHIRVNEPFPLQLRYEGKALPQNALKIYSDNFKPKQHGDASLEAVTDQKGEAKIVFNKPGRWLITTQHDAPFADKDSASGQNHRASLMVEVGDAKED